jgi:DNA repair protein RecO (recombination protein O)
MLNKDLAICIHSIDYSETSQVLTFFTREFGKIKAIAKGSRRAKSAFGGAFEIFSFGRIVFSQSSGAKLATLTEFEQQRGFDGLSSNLFALNSALFAVELMNNLTEEFDSHPQLFDNFLQFLKNVSDAKEKTDTLKMLILFQLSLLKEIGLQPVLSHCVNCKTRYEQRATNDEVYFSSSAGGIVCGDCQAAFQDKIKLSRKALGVFSDLKLIANAGLNTLAEIERILIRHFTGISGRKFKMARYIENPVKL